MAFNEGETNNISIMFWNTNLGLNIDKKNKEKVNNIKNAIFHLVKAYDVAILVLAEYPYDTEALSDEMSLLGRNFKTAYFIDNQRIKMLYDHKYTYDLIRDNKYSFVSLIKNQFTDTKFLLSGLHLPSKLHKKEEDIALEARKVMILIKEAEKQENLEKSIILGDFNQNPFDKGLVNCDSFHAIPCSEIVKRKKKRIVSGSEYQMFYNPMWNFLGDFDTRGFTYYYDSSGIDNIYQHIYDQVLIGAQMVEAFNQESLIVVSEVSGITLVKKNGIPDNKTYSDHLPIVFSLKEDKI